MAGKKQYFNRIVRYMKNMGTYEPEYRIVIDILAGMLAQYEQFEEEFEDGGGALTEEHTNKAGAVNERKKPVYTAMENLRKDIATYSDKLYLNPKAIGDYKTVKPDGGLVNVLEELSRDLENGKE